MRNPNISIKPSAASFASAAALLVLTGAFAMFSCVDSGNPEYDLKLLNVHPPDGATELNEFPVISVRFSYKFNEKEFSRGKWDEYFLYRFTNDSVFTDEWLQFPDAGPACSSISLSDSLDSVILKPGHFRNKTLFQVRILSGLESDGGHSLPFNHTFSYTIENDHTPPRLINTIPADGATLVERTATLTLFFDDLVKLHTDLRELLIKPVAGSFYTDTTDSCVEVMDRLVLIPADSLAGDTTYTVVVRPGLKDLSGNASDSSFVFRFTTRH